MEHKLNIIPPPMAIRISNPKTGELLGEFIEKDGLLTFEGKVDEAGKIFVDFVCASFNARIQYIINESHNCNARDYNFSKDLGGN